MRLHRCIGLVLGSLLLVCAHAWAELAFDTAGGDAWTFELDVTGHVQHQHCDSVAIESPRGTVNAVLIADRFMAVVPLVSGENRVQAICRKSGRERERSAAQIWRVQLPDTPKAWIRVRASRNGVRLDGGRTERAPALPVPIVEYEWRARAGNPATLQLVGASTLDQYTPTRGESIELATPARDGEYYVRLRARDALGRTDESTAVFRVVNGRPQDVNLTTEHPAWVDSCVLYGAAPYMFTPQTFAGIRDRLDEIAALGATAVWLSPVTRAAPDDFGYAVVDQFQLREEFGGEAGFKTLIDLAHALGLRMLVDFVPNHFSEFHDYYRDAIARGTRSPYYDWFERDASGQVTQYFDWAHLKNLNFDNPAVRNHIIAAAARYVRDFGVDGFRVDASWAVAERAPEFWPALRAELKRIDPDILLLAEASAREPYHVANGFDAAYDWSWNLGEWAWRDVFTTGVPDLDRLRAALTNEGEGFPPDTLILRFLNNNDTGERFVARFGPQTTKLAATLLFTLPGIPLIYNGDEIGATFQPYEEGPPLRWTDNELTAHYRRLALLRRASRTLQARELRLVHTNVDQSVLAFIRPGSTADEDLLVLLNFADREAAIRGGNRTAQAQIERFAEGEDVLGLARIHDSMRAIRIDPKSALVIAPRSRSERTSPQSQSRDD